MPFASSSNFRALSKALHALMSSCDSGFGGRGGSAWRRMFAVLRNRVAAPCRAATSKRLRHSLISLRSAAADLSASPLSSSSSNGKSISKWRRSKIERHARSQPTSRRGRLMRLRLFEADAVVR